ncbi:MAG TPA: nuclear transport factor 2 family protein [Flavitalea sp.]|nr:nuclear transport factor 2 family protein [Flavitalea sp.]
MTTKYFISMLLLSVALSSVGQNKENAVATAVESFRKAVVDADGAKLNALLATDLSYGHSDGRVEGKQELIDKLKDGRYDFVNMELTEQTIKVTGDIALVRNKLDGKTADEGKPNEAHLYVLMVWQKTKGGWSLLARQAVKQAPVTK